MPLPNLILFDDKQRENLLPLTFTRPCADLRCGILTVREKWEKSLGLKESSTRTSDYLSAKFPLHKSGDNLFINGRALPDVKLVKTVQSLRKGETLVKGKTLIAARLTADKFDPDTAPEDVQSVNCNLIEHIWDLFLLNGGAISYDFSLVTKGRKSQKLPSSNTISGKGKIFIEKGAVVEGAYMDASAGPVYIGKDAEVMGGAAIRGPFALCEGAQLKLGAKIYGPTTIGPFCRVGGEVNNSIFMGYSNKAHDGFIGNSVIGEWCNLGAGTSCSNLKNTYENVRVWSYPENKFINSGQLFCGLIMGDHSKCGINTMFNTGTVVGVSCNIFGSGFPRTFIPSFSWGGAAGFTEYKLDKAMKTAARVMERRSIKLSEADIAILEHLNASKDTMH